jgi:hypothetical protein
MYNFLFNSSVWSVGGLGAGLIWQKFIDDQVEEYGRKRAGELAYVVLSSFEVQGAGKRCNFKAAF